MNNIDAGRRIANFLHERKARRVAFLAPKAQFDLNANWKNRFFGLAGELALLGSGEGVHALTIAPGDAKAVAAALRGRNRPDAIVCGNDEIAIALLGTLRTLGKRVPGDVAVVGFDDSGPSQCSEPALTTVSQPVGKIAVTAFKTLLARIRYPNNDPREIRLPAPLVVRASA